MKKISPLIVLIALMLPSLACGLTGWQYRPNNEVRLAAFEYARQLYGPVDDLVVHFTRGEPRIKFEQQHRDGGHTVWLYQAGAREYFAVRPAEATYLYIQQIEYDEERTMATTNIYYGDGTGYEGRQLTLVRDMEGDRWTVTDARVIDENQETG